MWWGEFYGVLTLGAVVLAWGTSKRHPDALGLSLMLLVAWSLTNVMDVLWEPPESKVFNTVTDLTIGSLALRAWWGKWEGWKLNLAILFGLQSLAHPIYQGWVWFGEVELTTYNYEVFLNATFALQLLCVVWPGGRDVVRDFTRLRRRALESHHRGAAP